MEAVMHQQALSFTPASRRNDPITSYEAEAEITESGLRGEQQRKVRSLVHRYPGRTSRELAELAELDRYMVARRLPEIEPVHVRKGEQRKCKVGRRNASTWWPAS
jgi:hypothetical protein